MRKKTLLLLGGIMIMATVTGCWDKPSNESRKEIIQKSFIPFISMFPTNDLTVLYKKDGELKNLDVEDLGTWVISSYLDTNINNTQKTEGVVLAFNRNIKKSQGFYSEIIYENNNFVEKKYPIYFENGKLELVKTVDDQQLINKIKKFKIIMQYLTLSEEYLNLLDVKDFRINEQVKSIQYILNDGDKNIENLKNMYGHLFHIDNIILAFESSGDFGKTTSSTSLEIFFDDKYENYLTTSIRFSDSSYYDSVIKGE